VVTDICITFALVIKKEMTMTYTLTNNRCYDFMNKEYALLNCVVNAVNVVYNPDNNSFFDSDDNRVLGWGEYKYVSLKNPIVTNIERERDRIDGVLLFGDGTIEFHLENDREALCWVLFDLNEIDEVINELENLF
jgi:hypothetical protein